MPKLILLKSPVAGTVNQAFPLEQPITVLGRDNACDVVIPSPSNATNSAVSRKHAQIINKSGQFYVEDLKSRNGTMVNNEMVKEPRLLKHEDRLKICDYLYSFHDENAPKRLPEEYGSSFFGKPDEAADGQSTIEHALAARDSGRILDSQPSERFRVLFDISQGLSRSLDLGKLMDSIADSMLRVFKQADRCFVILKEEPDRLVTKVVRTRARRRRRRPAGVFSRTIVRRAIASGEAYLSEDATTDSNLGAAMSVAGLQIRSVMCVPLTIPEDSPIGAVQIDTQDRTKKFRQSDLELLMIIANLAAVAVDKAHLHEAALDAQRQQSELDAARSVQLAFLPQSEPLLPGYEFYHHYSPALTVGGDYYDFVPFTDGRVAVLLGDVAGKGVPASLLMARLSAEARSCLLLQPNLVMAIRALNEQLIRGGIGDRFVTLSAAVIDPVRHRAVLVNAGHVYPMIHRGGRLLQAIQNDDTGLPLGIMPGYEYTSIECALDPGDSLLIFSDGVTDAMDPTGRMFELDGVHAAIAVDAESLNRPSAIGERIIRSVKNHAAGRAQNDDIAFVCVGRLLEHLPPKSNDTGSLHLPAKREVAQ